MRIVIDPGHSGPVEPGATDKGTGLQEHAIVLDISRKLRVLLDREGIECILTREGPIETDDLAFRCRAAIGADLFISIHVNSFGDTAANGVEVYHFPGSECGMTLAGCIQSRLVLDMGRRDRGIKPANLFVLRETSCPAVLVECCFLSNDADRATLSERGRAGYAMSIYKGILDYRGQRLF